MSDNEQQNVHWCIPYVVNEFLDSPFEFCELFPVIKSLKSNKSPGIDGVPYEFFKHSLQSFINQI